MHKKISLLLICLILTALMAGAASAEFPILRRGSKGVHVTALQTQLKALGFFRGRVDGKFGAATFAAVKRFQSQNELKADGVVNAVTAQRMGLVPTVSVTPVPAPAAPTPTPTALADPPVAPEGDAFLLACVVYGESSEEPYIGQVAIAAVVLNRVRDKGFPNTIPAVVYQPDAFSVVYDGKIQLTPDETAMRAARDAMNGMDPTGGALYYFDPAKSPNAFMQARPEMITIGNYRFCS